MLESALTRRGWLASTATAAAGAIAAAGSTRSTAAAIAEDPFIYGLNTSTIRGQNLPIARAVELIAKAGYGGIEPWISELDAHVKSGESLEALGNTLKDLGLRVESAIGFFEWAVDDETRRRKALDEAKRNMELVRKIGGKRLAAPPAGAVDRSDLDLKRVAERYRKLLELGDEMGVVPQVEVWGFSKTLGQLGEAAQVAITADHPSRLHLARRVSPL